MADRKYNTKYARRSSKPEEMSTDTKVDRAGYIPKKRRIEDMLVAGQRLVEARREDYDGEIEEELDEIPLGATRRAGSDTLDIIDEEREVKSRLEQSKLQAISDAKNKAKVKRKVEKDPEAPPGASVEPPENA